MTAEKQIVLNKIDSLLAKKTAKLINELPDVHEVSDGIIIRFFGGWDNCEENELIKHKQIQNFSNSAETVIFYYLPKNATFDLKKRDFIGCVTCLNGKLEIETKGNTFLLEDFSKIYLESNEFQGVALENSYVITTSD